MFQIGTVYSSVQNNTAYDIIPIINNTSHSFKNKREVTNPNTKFNAHVIKKRPIHSGNISSFFFNDHRISKSHLFNISINILISLFYEYKFNFWLIRLLENAF
jgi:hypothetical protein